MAQLFPVLLKLHLLLKLETPPLSQSLKVILIYGENQSKQLEAFLLSADKKLRTKVLKTLQLSVESFLLLLRDGQNSLANLFHSHSVSTFVHLKMLWLNNVFEL